MSKNMLNVTVQLRHGTAAEWADTSVAAVGANRVLAKGELGIEIDTRLFKIGNGTDAYKDLQYANDFDVSEAQSSAYTITPTEGQTDQEAFDAWKAEAGNVANKGDIFIMKRLIAEGKYSYTGYVYDGTNLVAMDGNYSAENVYFDKDLTYTTAVGTLKPGASGSGTLSAAGKSVNEVLSTILAEEANPTTTQPSVSISSTTAKDYEVGSTVIPAYNATFNEGKYSYDSSTGVSVTSWAIKDSDNNTAETASGNMPQLVVTATTNYTITATANYGAGNIPKTNLGNDYAAGQIKAGSKSATSGKITGYRNNWYGYKASGSEFANITALTSADIKGLTAIKTLPAKISANNASQLVLAIPEILDKKPILKQASPPLTVDVTGTYTATVGGVNDYAPIDYDVYYVSFAKPASGATEYNITWENK